MIHYASGIDAAIGDVVDLDGTPATVESIIDTEDDMRDWGLDERGLMFTSDKYGLVFQSCTSKDDIVDDIVFVKRADGP